MIFLYRQILHALLFQACLYYPAISQHNASLIIEVEGIQQASGHIMVAVYDNPDSFLSDDFFTSGKFLVNNTGKLVLNLSLPYGEYGISIFHDIDADEILDTNWLKVPTEPIGFSNNAKARYGPPKFEKAKFTFTNEGQTLRIFLN